MESECECMYERDKVLVEENMKLVFFTIHKYFPSFAYDEDLHQVGMIGLCNAARTWDESKSTFSTYASKVILNEIRKEFNRRRRVTPTVSLNYELDNGEGNREEMMNFLVGESDVDYFDVDAFYEKLSPIDQTVFDMRMAGCTETAIAEALGVSVMRICQRLKRMQYKWRKFYGH